MRHGSLIALAFLSLAACSTDSPYRERSPLFLSGVEARPLPEGRVQVVSSGAGQDRPQVLAAWAMRKSAEFTLQQGKTHFEVKSVKLGGTPTSVAGMGATLPIVELVILPLGAPGTGRGFYDAAAVKKQAEAFADGDLKLVPPGLLPEASG